MKHYYYYLNCFTGFDWAAARMFRFKKLAGTNLRDIRISDAGVAVKDAGWHWTYIGDADFIKQKIEAFSHSEFDNDYIKKGIDQRIENNTDTLGRAFELQLAELDTDFYPKYLRENKEKYAKYIKEL
jgi:beta-1,4-mannosyl-glycoprotein beta-1,4-N-acetylglucosaminyltransferase